MCGSTLKRGGRRHLKYSRTPCETWETVFEKVLIFSHWGAHVTWVLFYCKRPWSQWNLESRTSCRGRSLSHMSGSPVKCGVSEIRQRRRETACLLQFCTHQNLNLPTKCCQKDSNIILKVNRNNNTPTTHTPHVSTACH